MFSLDYLRSFRILNFAIFDFVASYLGILLLSPLLTRLARFFHLNITTKHWLWLTLPIGVVCHLIFQTQTPMTKMFLNPAGNYDIKIILLVMTYLGLKDSLKKSKK